MTVEDLSGGAPAPAEAPAIAEITSNTPEPIKEAGPRGAIDRAFEAIERGEAAPKTDKQVPAEADTASDTPTERARNPDGTFAAKDPAAVVEKPADTQEQQKPEAPSAGGDAPVRFSADAKAAWKDAPDPVKAEVHRAIRELEAGVEKYRADATTYNNVFRPYVEMAQRSNIDPQRQLQEYVKIDSALAQDFNQGIGMIFRNAGIDPRQWASQVMGQPAPEQSPQDQTIQRLLTEIEGLKRGLGGVNQTIEQQMASQRSQEVGGALEKFTGTLSETDRRLFHELDAEIAAHLQRDPNATLSAAFEAAKTDATARYQRMFPAASSAPAAPPASVVPDPAAQTRKGQLSVTGAPGSGSNPDTRRPPSSARAALDNAFAQIGL